MAIFGGPQPQTSGPMPVQIVAITQGTRPRPGTLDFQATRIIQYTVGGHGPFTLEVPAADFTTARVNQLLEEQAQQIRGLFPAG